MRSVGALAAGALVALVSAGCGGGPGSDPGSSSGPAPDRGPSLDAVVAQVEDRVELYDGIATGVIALVRVGGETEVITRGLAEVDGRRPMTAGATFPIASVTKPMTATLVLQLVEDGRIALDDDIRDLLPQLRAVESPITVEQVLSHRSGLIRDPPDSAVDRFGPGETSALVEASAHAGLDFEPGTDGRYSNLGFAALGLLVERTLDRSLADALAEQVFEPAEMVNSSLAEDPTVQGYVGSKAVRNYYLNYLPGAGSVVATATDVDAFFQHLWAGDLLSEDVVADMGRSRGSVLVGVGFRPDYGFGLMRQDFGCGTAVGHSGRIGGFTVEAWTLDEQDRSTVVAVNDHNADDVARGLVRVALCDG